MSLDFIAQFFFALLKPIRLNSRHYFIMKVSNKWEIQQIAFNGSSDIDFQGFMNTYKKILQNCFPSRFKKDLLERI